MSGTTNLNNISLPGTVVSMWKQIYRASKISLKTCHIIEDFFQCGFRSWLSVPCVEVNCYFGNHYCSRLKNRPEKKNGEHINDFYARQSNKCKENIPLCEQFVSKLTKLTL